MLMVIFTDKRRKIGMEHILSLEESFSHVHDPRVERTKLHKLQDILIIAICAVICGAENWVDIEHFGKEKYEWLSSILELPNGIPSHDTFNRVFARLNPQELEQCFFDWVSSLVEVVSGVIAIDGKTMRRSHDKKKGIKSLHMVSAWASENRLVLAQLATEKKSNEITAIPELLNVLDLKGCIVTIDAMGLQKKIIKQVVKQLGDYAIALKKNQGTLYRSVSETFEEAKKDGFASVKHQKIQIIEKGHGRQEIRRYWIIDDEKIITTINPKGAWKNLRSIGMVESERCIGGKVTKEVRYYITSLKGDVYLFARAVRCHWGIENSVHWVLDVVFHEDLSRTRIGHSAHNFGILRHIALNLLRREETAKCGIHTKRLKSGWNTEYLEKVLIA
jgi:predicted transposase YbfD/YdcC